MPLFVCDQCSGVDNTACGGSYWVRLINKKPGPILCCECHTGKWHGQFPKRIYDPAKDMQTQFIYVPAHLKATGKK